LRISLEKGAVRMIITKNDEHVCDNDIAIIGMSGRFPGADSIQEFWEHLVRGDECVSFFSDEELRAAGVSEELLKNRFYVKAGVVLDHVDLFDADFFGYTPKEAELMDPQQRLFLETAWEALEDAGYDAQRYDGLIGVYAGAGFNHYLVRNIMMSEERDAYSNNMQLIVENDKDFLATRVNHKLNLRGPGVSVQTACSSSLVAIHIACQSILNGECDMALAGGVSIKLPMSEGYLYQPGGILSPDGHCKTFDNDADGTIFGSGTGVVVLKSLNNAIEEKDNIYAVIKGSAINNDGAAKVSYTAPSVDGQAGVIVEAIANSGVDINNLSYIETHGTGTSLGDPIELSALNKAFHIFTDRKQFCNLGSSKPNIGHLDAASGVTGVIKTVLLLKNEIIPPNINYKTQNEGFHQEHSPFIVNDHAVEWKSEDKTRCAGVSSFGVGGTNAHIILEEVSDQRKISDKREWQIGVISAKTNEALLDYCKKYIAYLEESNEDLQKICYTMALGREQFQKRKVLIGKDKKMFIEQLEDAVKQHVPYENQMKWKNLNYVFDEEGIDSTIPEQWKVRGEPLYDAIMRECAGYISEIVEKDRLDPTIDQSDLEKIIRRLEKFTIQISIAKAMIELHVVPQKVTGIASGMLAALAVLDMINLKEAVTLRYYFEQKNQAEYDRVLKEIQLNHLNMQKTTIQTLYVGGVVYGIHKEYIEYDHMIKNNGAGYVNKIPLEEFNLFFDGKENDVENESCNSIHMFYKTRGKSTEEAFLQAIGLLWTNGVDIDWSKYYQGLTIQRVSIPTYPFQRKRYWIEPSSNNTETSAANQGKGTLRETNPNNEIQDMMLDQNEMLVEYIERIIASIWTEVIGVKEISSDDNFFALGGHSLLATNIIYQLEMIFSLDLTLEVFFEYPTVKELGNYILSRYENKEDLKIIVSTYLEVLDNAD